MKEFLKKYENGENENVSLYKIHRNMEKEIKKYKTGRCLQQAWV